MRLSARTGHPDFLDLPWDEPLADWDHERLEQIPAGLHRHVVRFVRYPEGLYVLKELPERYTEREYRFLNHLADEGVPTVEAVGKVTGRTSPSGEPLESVIITRHLSFSLPYRLFFSRRADQKLVRTMIDALANLLVRIHLVGFYWGDCSLSNTLFRRDGHQLAAYLVDTETGELQPELSRGQRLWDVEAGKGRIMGELLDLEAQGLLPEGLDPVEFADDLEAAYTGLWSALTDVEVFGKDERYRIHQRLDRVNSLGYDVGEVEVVASHDHPDSWELHLHIVEPARHRRLLFELTGLHAEEVQARALLNDIKRYHVWREAMDGRRYAPDEAARSWLQHSYHRHLGRIPLDYWGRREAPQLFVEILDHWCDLSAARGRDVSVEEATDDYVERVLRPATKEDVLEDPTAFDTDEVVDEVVGA